MLATLASRHGIQAANHRDKLSAKRRSGGIEAQMRNVAQPAARNGNATKKIIERLTPFPN
jgi:hypothetical protein